MHERVETSGLNPRELRQYMSNLQLRIEAGAREYGDESFAKKAASTIEEIQEEVLDIAGWGYILYTRLERLRNAALAARLDAD